MKTYPDWLSYSRAVGFALETVSDVAFEVALERLASAAEKGATIYVAGNGGSAAIANHLACDFGKGSGLRVVSLSSNVPVITAYANDTGYENSIAGQIATLVKPGDVVVLISSSGNSPNILKALKAAKDREAFVIGLSGFDGGSLARSSDVSLHVDSDNYGCVEDTHSSLMHALSQALISENERPVCGAV